MQKHLYYKMPSLNHVLFTYRKKGLGHVSTKDPQGGSPQGIETGFQKRDTHIGIPRVPKKGQPSKDFPIATNRER